MPRSQIAALAVLLISLGIVFVLVGNTGVSTGVFLPDEPILTSTTIPLPEPSAENWTEVSPGQFVYAVDSTVPAQITHETMLLDDFLLGNGFEPPADDVAYPLLDVQDQFRNSLNVQIAAAGFALDPDAWAGPMIEIVEGVPVASLHLQIDPQTMSDAQSFPGLDMSRVLINHGTDEVVHVEYVLQGEPDPVVYRDFRAWLAANMSDLASAAEDAGADPTTETDATTTEDEMTEPAEAALEPETSTEVEGIEEVELPGTWLELAPGQLIYTANQNAMIIHGQVPLEELALGMGLDLAEGEVNVTALELLETMRTEIEVQFEEQGITTTPNTFEGPSSEVVEGVPVAYLRMTLEAQTLASGEPFSAQEFFQALIELGDGQIRIVQFVYQGDSDPAIYADFRTWLEENVAQLAILDEVDAVEDDAVPVEDDANADETNSTNDE